MGSGCFRANASTDHPRSPTDRSRNAGQAGEDFAEVPNEYKKELQTVVQLAGKSNLPDDKLDEVLSILSNVSPFASSSWFKDWCVKASAKARGGLLLLMQRTIGRPLEANLLVADELVASRTNEVLEVIDFCRLADMCREALSIEETSRSGIHAAILVLSNASSSGQVAVPDGHGTLSSVVPALDRLVLFFRASLLANITSSARNRQQWRDFETYIGLPHLEQHMSLLSCGAKAVLLNLMLVPEGIPPTIVVVNRESALLDAGKQIPDDRACVVSPYFESATGTKTVQGRHVEGGEGHGPRKEFFIATSSNALRRWGNCISSSSRASPSAPVQVSFQGNRIIVDRTAQGDEAQRASSRLMFRILAKASVGDQLQLDFSNGVKAERLITASHEDSGVSVASHFESSVCDSQVVVEHCSLQKALIPLFEFHRGTGQHWFSAYASELEHSEHGNDLKFRYFTFGKLLLLSLANRCRIAFALPVIFFRLLLNAEMAVSLDDLKGFDDDLHGSLKKCLKMGMNQFKGLKEIEELPVEMTREEYVLQKVKETFTPQAMDEIRRGFGGARRNTDIFKSISASDLRQMICPIDNANEEIDIRRIFKVVIEDEMANCKVFVDAFWYVVDNLAMEEKKLFLRFVTGLEAPPEPGTEKLIIELPFSAFSKHEYIAMLEMLPQAHTCTNTLELPNYYEALKESGTVIDDEEENGGVFEQELRKLMKDKLLLAIRETGGYELDAVDPILTGESPSLSQPLQSTISIPARSEARDEKVEHAGFVSHPPKSFPTGNGVGIESWPQSRKKTPEPDGYGSDGRPISEERPRSRHSVEAPVSPKPPSSESLQSLHSDPGEFDDPVPPPVVEEPFRPQPPRRLEPVRADSFKQADSFGALAPVRAESIRGSEGFAARTELHKGMAFTLEPLRTPPIPPPIPFIGEFGSPHKSSSNAIGDGIIDPGLASLLQSRYDTHEHPPQNALHPQKHAGPKISSTEIDHLIEELELDMRR